MQLKARTAAEVAARAEEQAKIATAAARKPAAPPKKAFLRPRKVVIDREEYDALRIAAGQRDAAAQDAAEAAQNAAQQALAAAQEQSREIIEGAIDRRRLEDKLTISRLENSLKEYQQMEAAHPQRFREMRAEQQRSRNRSHTRSTERS